MSARVEAPSTENHTPGPWIAAASASSIVGWPIVGPRGRAVASVHCRRGDTPEGAQINSEAGANARLIAAAPELYGICKQVLDWVHGKREGRCVTDELTQRLVAAIAKAEGRS